VVMRTESATSPRAMSVMRFDEVPPGQDLRRARPHQLQVDDLLRKLLTAGGGVKRRWVSPAGGVCGTAGLLRRRRGGGGPEEDHPGGDVRGELEEAGEHGGDEGHERELAEAAHAHLARRQQHLGEVVEGERHAREDHRGGDEEGDSVAVHPRHCAGSDLPPAQRRHRGGGARPKRGGADSQRLDVVGATVGGARTVGTRVGATVGGCVRG
jgi:hypothetical protein